MIIGIDNFEKFKVFFDVIYDITDLIELQLFPDHINCCILDKAHTRFMTVEYKKDFFSVYEIDDVKSVVIDAEDMHKIIKSSNKIDNVLLEVNDDYLICKFESDNGNSRIFEFTLPADYIETAHPPSIDLPLNVDVDLDNIKQGVKDLNILGSGEIQFTFNNGMLYITSGQEITTNYSLNIPVEYDGDDVSAKYTLEYIEQLLKFNKINKSVGLKMGDNYPLVYTFENEDEGIIINGVIAPRIDMDD